MPYERSSSPKPWADKKPRAKEKPSGPIEWNDAPSPKQRKPKPSEGKPYAGESKPKYKAKTAAQARPEGVVETFKKKPSAAVGASKPYAGKPSKFAGKPGGKPGGKAGGKAAKYADKANPKLGKPSPSVSKQKFDPGKPKRKPA